MRDIHRREGLKQKQHILDYMGSTELAANLFHTTQAEDKLRRENVRSKDRAGQLHKEVGRKMQGILIQVNTHAAFVSAPRPKWSEN